MPGDNPFAAKMQQKNQTRSIGRGLAAVKLQNNTLVAFAARDGSAFGSSR